MKIEFIINGRKVNPPKIAAAIEVKLDKKVKNKNAS
jgi:hypothetical protein